MRLPDTTQAGVDRLNRKQESDHFVVYFSMRNPPLDEQGVGFGAYGIRNYYVVSHYLAALERAYDTLTGPPFLWPKRPKPKSEAYILYLPSVGMSEPFTAVDRDWVPYICLPCRSQEPMLQSALNRAEVEAVHEATHLFCWSARPPKTLAEKKWLWFGEATAVFMEGAVFPGNLDAIRFGLDWCDFPEWPLDDEHAWYQAGFFARYLARRFGCGLISKLWNESLPSEGPLDALNRMLPPEEASASPSVCRIFGEYAHDSYFLWDHRSHGFHQEVFLRFSYRALTEGLILEAGEQVQLHGALNHLACRYFRIQLRPGVKRLEALFRSKSGANDIFRCFLSAHERSQQRGVWRELTGAAAITNAKKDFATNRGGKAVAGLERAEIENCEWLLLTVANCGTRSGAADLTGTAHDDDKKFEIEIRAR